MRHLLPIAVILIFVTLVAAFQPQSVDREAESRTKLGSFEGIRGEVVVAGFSLVGTIASKYEGRVEIKARELTVASTGRRELGLTVTTVSGARFESTDSVFVDFDEIDGIVAGLDYISKLDQNVTKLESFQADFQTKGGMKLSTASSKTGMLFAVQCGSSGSKLLLFDAAADIPKFRVLLLKAKEMLESASK